MHNPTRNFQKCTKSHEELKNCTKSHEELPKMQKIPRGTSKSAQNPMRNFQICTKSHHDLPKMHKIPGGISKMYTIPRGTLKYTQSDEKLQKMPKITGKTSKYAQNPTRIFRKCTKSQGNIA